jgi:hypothetical protein
MWLSMTRARVEQVHVGGKCLGHLRVREHGVFKDTEHMATERMNYSLFMSALVIVYVRFERWTTEMLL